MGKKDKNKNVIKRVIKNKPKETVKKKREKIIPFHGNNR